MPLAATTGNALLVTALLNVDTPVDARARDRLVGETQHASHVHVESGLGDRLDVAAVPENLASVRGTAQFVYLRGDVIST